MANTKMVSADLFLAFLVAEVGRARRSDLLRKWTNGNMSARHLDKLIADTGCFCVTEPTGGRFKTWVYVASMAPMAVAT